MIQVDKIITISLKENYDRQKLAQTEIAKLNLKTEFFFAERDKGHEERGCFHSHISVCQQALANNDKTLLVFEDDVRILSYHQTQINRINDFIQSKANHFDILYLGLIIGKMWFCGYPSLVRAKGAGAHAYILSQRGIKKLATYKYEGIPIDKIMKNEFKCYSIYPIIAEQYPETLITSTITPTRIDNETKDEIFWQKNYQKQKTLPWKNLHKAVIEILSMNFCNLFTQLKQ